MYRLLPRYQLTVIKPYPLSYPRDPQTIGEHIRKRRLELRLLQGEVAKQLGVSTASITLWEKSENIPQITYFPRIAKFLGYSLWQFDTSTLIGKILDYRHKKGLSTLLLGKLIGVSNSTVQLWERGSYQPNEKMLQKLNEFLENKKPLE